MNTEELREQIIALRVKKGLTQENLAELCNIDIRTLQRIESGEVKPRAHTLNVIFKALGEDGLPTMHSEKKSQPARISKKKMAIFSGILVFAGLAVFVVTHFLYRDIDEFVFCESNTSPITRIDIEMPNLPENVYSVKFMQMGGEFMFIDYTSFENGRIQIDLPKEITTPLYQILRGHPVVRNNDQTRFLFAMLEGFDEAGTPIGRFEYVSVDRLITASFAYADSDAILSGLSNSGDAWELTVLQGWNWIFHIEVGGNHVIWTTTRPDEEMVWRYREYVDGRRR